MQRWHRRHPGKNFGVNSHIRDVADNFAKAGYTAIAPALFDRSAPGIELGYEGDDIAQGRDIAFPLGWEHPALDMAAAVEVASAAGKVGIVGYCWGGSLAYLAGCKLGVSCAVGYYGGQIMKIVEADPSAKLSVPAMLHFGEHDTGIPLDDVEQVRQANPDVPIHMYNAGHGFNCDHHGSYDADSSKVALERTLAFFAEHVDA